MQQLLVLFDRSRTSTKREISMVHAMASLPEPERVHSGIHNSCRWLRKNMGCASSCGSWAKDIQANRQLNNRAKRLE